MRSRHYLIFLSAALMFVLSGYGVIAQSAVTGEWSATIKGESADNVNISFKRGADNGRFHTGSTFSFDELQGLSRSASGPASFRIVRDAGTFEMEGSFTNGSGKGTYRFTPDRGYLEAMRSRGFDFNKTSKDGRSQLDDRIFTAAILNVTVSLADGLRSANFGELNADDLFKAAIFKITPEFMTEMASSGFPDLDMGDLVKARIFKIDGNFLREMHQVGFANNDFDQVVKYRIFKVTPEYVNALRAEGLSDISPEEVVKLRIFNIDAQFIRDARAEDPNVTVEQLVNRRIGVGRK